MRGLQLTAVCLMLAVLPAAAEPVAEQEGPLSPCVTSGTAKATAADDWVVEIATAFSEEKALEAFKRAQQTYSDILGNYEPIVVEQCDLSLGEAPGYSARIVMPDEDKANDLCGKLEKAGGACLVQKD